MHNIRRKTNIKSVIAIALAVSMLGGCTVHEQTKENDGNTMADENAREQNQDTTDDSAGKQDKGESSDSKTEQSAQEQEQEPAVISGRPSLIKDVEETAADSIVPCVEEYTVAPDLSNIDNLGQFYLDDDRQKELLSENGFVVQGDAGWEFFEIYESNRYAQIPNFVTVDSLMHTYHLYFGYLLRNTEKNYLYESVSQLGNLMLSDSGSQYEQLKGTEWEDAARRNVAFFAVGVSLFGGDVQIDDAAKEIVDHELSLITQAQGIEKSKITGAFEDYSQYKPRGYYEGDEKLEQYFRAMMWYGRIHFTQENTDLNRSALLITKALSDDAQAYRLWESVYAVTSFFAGASDDMGVCEYAPVIREVYGENVDTADLAGNEKAFEDFHKKTGELPAPQINSIPIWDGEENIIPGFRFMGQRFTIDGAIMQKLIYSSVEESSDHEKRLLPDALDVPAALGSDSALTILEATGVNDYPGYAENMEKLRQSLSEENDTLWSASLYAGWLDTLRPLLTPKGEGYPIFMQNEEWTKKDLECFAGSFTELKHDTILYAKQVIAEMGGGYDEEIDDRGYVEPEPLVYERFVNLADQTASGLKSYGMLSESDEENMTILSQMAGQMLTISEKELRDETLSEEEYEFIRCYGGSIEHFWYEAVKDSTPDPVTSAEFAAAIVADIATDPNGRVLEVATGNPSEIIVAVKVDGKIKLARGSVYSFYQFEWPIENRLTDTQWRLMMGIQADENGYYNDDNKMEKPEWTTSYRFKYEWE